jgi:hypothetical protein
MNSLWALALLCVSPVETVGNITIANRVPVACTQILGSPLLPVAMSPISEMGYSEATEAAGAVAAPPKAETPKKVKKRPTASRKQSSKGCKRGRWRNARGICGIWARR